MRPVALNDPNKLLNWETNRWAFNPEFGYSQRFSKQHEQAKDPAKMPDLSTCEGRL
jgi:hypothetical protein